MMRRLGYIPGAGLGRNHQGIVEWPDMRKNEGLFGHGYEPSRDEIREMRNYMRRWSKLRRQGTVVIEPANDIDEESFDVAIRSDAESVTSSVESTEPVKSVHTIVQSDDEYVKISKDFNTEPIEGASTDKSIKGRVIAEQLADSPAENNEFLKAEFRDEEIMAVEEEVSNTKWLMYFDGAVNNQGQGVGAVLISPRKEYIPISIKLQFKCKNNMAEYESCIAGKGHPPVASGKERKSLQKLASNFVICGEELHRRSFDGIQLLRIDEDQATELVEQTHEGVCGPHMNGKMLSKMILRLGYYWPTMEADCYAYVKKCHKCQVYANLIHGPPSQLHSLTSPWLFSVWGIDIIGKLSPKSSSGHEYILVAIDYFTKWIEAASYASLTSASIAKFIKANIICRYGKEVERLCEEFKIKHHKSSSYRPQTNKAVEAANKNIKVIISKMTETYKDWSNKLPYALWAYRTSIRSSTGATPYSQVYGMEVVLHVELRIPSLRVMMEAGLPEFVWAQARYQELQMIDEKRLKALYHV
ncbi:uncharacterized protein LOC143891133 [Tasmannia lanceolata]|uniref:uncharacterized protein LOC143891133 n=1 Tax=Tasmannia lanceolata TaxID=3420 RepID=UPI0040647E32